MFEEYFKWGMSYLTLPKDFPVQSLQSTKIHVRGIHSDAGTGHIIDITISIVGKT